MAGLRDALDHLRQASAGAASSSLCALVRQAAAAQGDRERPVELTAPRSLIREMLLVAIDEAGEALAGRCTGLLRGDTSVADLRASLADLSGLIELLDAAR
jgi:hypothetical protein